MVVAGVPDPVSDHAGALANFALDITREIQAINVERGCALDLRVGINTGAVVAGIIGKRKFAFDLWGDCVNTASRMESHSEPGRIQITQETYELLKDRYETESHYAHWDQRWVQISVDSGPFINVQQLNDDPMGGWLRAQIDLLPYYDINREHTIQVRFFFDTIDKYNNEFEGWYIDDFQVAASPASLCPEDPNEPNDSAATATDLTIGTASPARTS